MVAGRPVPDQVNGGRSCGHPELLVLENCEHLALRELAVDDTILEVLTIPGHCDVGCASEGL